MTYKFTTLTSLLTGHSCKSEAITSHVLNSPFDELALNEATSVNIYISISLQQLPAHCRSRAVVSIALVIINMNLEIIQSNGGLEMIAFVL